MEEKILNFILECAEVQKLVPFSLIEEEFNLILDEALKCQSLRMLSGIMILFLT